MKQDLERENQKLKIQVARLEAQLNEMADAKAREGSVVMPRSLYLAMTEQRRQTERDEIKTRAEFTGDAVVMFVGFEHTHRVFNLGRWLIGDYYRVEPNTLVVHSPTFDPKDPYAAPDFAVVDMMGSPMREELTAFRPVNRAAGELFSKAGLPMVEPTQVERRAGSRKIV
jgi:hypothetical protein